MYVYIQFLLFTLDIVSLASLACQVTHKEL